MIEQKRASEIVVEDVLITYGARYMVIRVFQETDNLRLMWELADRKGFKFEYRPGTDILWFVETDHTKNPWTDATLDVPPPPVSLSATDGTEEQHKLIRDLNADIENRRQALHAKLKEHSIRLQTMTPEERERLAAIEQELRDASKPLRDATEATERITGADLAVRVTGTGTADEDIQPLCHNWMIAAGFKLDGQNYWKQVAHTGGLILHVHRRFVNCVVANDNRSEQESMTCIPCPKTCGELKLLCKVLNIPLEKVDG